MTTMPSSKEDGTTAAAEQLGSISLGWSAERKDNDATKNSNAVAAKKMCSACGKESDALKKCTACKSVWYCDKECQKKHRKEHKKECKLIKEVLDKRGGKLDLGTELDVGPLGKVPQREECPICMRVLPLHPNLQSYWPCCGNTLCSGCDLQHLIKNEELADTCAFCRTAVEKSGEEVLTRVRKRIERNDPIGMVLMSSYYQKGQHGLLVDEAKCVELMRQSADLGYPPAQYQLGCFYRIGEMGLEQNDEEALKCWEKAAENGHIVALHNLGSEAAKSGDDVAAMRHLRLSASGGMRKSMSNLIQGFERGLLNHADLAETLQAMYRSTSEMRSQDRDQYIKHLKRTGKYAEEYGW